MGNGPHGGIDDDLFFSRIALGVDSVSGYGDFATGFPEDVFQGLNQFDLIFWRNFWNGYPEFAPFKKLKGSEAVEETMNVLISVMLEAVGACGPAVTVFQESLHIMK